MNLRSQQQILIQDIFNITFKRDQKTSTMIQLQEFPKEINRLGSNISLLQYSSYFDSLLMERLQISGTQILAYLQQCLRKCNYVIDKPWNQSQHAQAFIKQAHKAIRNFVFLTLQQATIFPDQLQIDSQSQKMNGQIISVAMRLLSHFQRHGFNLELLNIVYPKIQDQFKGSFTEALIDTLLARVRFQTILQPKSYFYLSLLAQLMNIEAFKKTFFHSPKCPFIPAPEEKLQGSMIDTVSPFGLFMRMSILGYHPSPYYFQEAEANRDFEKRLILQFGKDKLNRDRLKYYGKLQNQFYEKQTQIFRVLLRKDSQKDFFRWIYSLILSNLQKSKLGSRLQNANTSNLSHDGLLVNTYCCLLQLCKVILNRQQQKYKNIDIQYYIFNDRIRKCKYEALNKREKHEKMDLNKQFGTITQFFFLCLEFAHIGLVQAQDNFVEFMEYKEKLEKQKTKLPPNNPHMKQLLHEIQKLQSKSIRYFIVLMDQALINGTVKLFDMLLFLLPKWLHFSYSELKDCKIRNYKVPQIACYLPQHLLDTLYKFHLTNFKFKPNYLNLIGIDHVHQIVNLTCLLLSEIELISNPYISANFIQLIFVFLHQTKSGIMWQVFKDNQIAQHNLTLGMIRFYCDIAVTGSSHQFYSKFKYRYDVNKIFTSLWVHQAYRKNLQEYFGLSVFQKFLNMVMTDTTYCFDQTNDSYEKYKEIQSKRQSNTLNAQDQATQQRLSSLMSSTLVQSTSNLKLMRDLSAWSPSTFLSQAQRKTVVPLLNSILKTFIDPASFASNRQLLSQYRFEKQNVLSDLLQIYVNIDINEQVSNEIVKDTRNYKKQYFSKALQKASNQHCTTIDTLEKFEKLIGKLSNAINQEQDQEIYGEIPQKYQCSLMNTLMKNPVLLPGSGNIVEKVNIQRTLLIDERDPFTRAPLKLNQIKAMNELKMEIEEWKKKRRAQLKKGDRDIKYGKIKVNKKEDQDIFETKIMDINEEEQDSMREAH